MPDEQELATPTKPFDVLLGDDDVHGTAMWYVGTHDDAMADFAGQHEVSRGISSPVQSDNWKPADHNNNNNKFFAEVWIYNHWYPVLVGDLVVKVRKSLEVYSAEDLQNNAVEVVYANSPLRSVQPNPELFKLNRQMYELAMEHGLEDHIKKIQDGPGVPIVDGNNVPDEEPPLEFPEDTDVVKEVLTVTLAPQEQAEETKWTMAPHPMEGLKAKPVEVVTKLVSEEELSYMMGATNLDELKTRVMVLGEDTNYDDVELVAIRRQVSLKEFSAIIDTVSAKIPRPPHASLVNIFNQPDKVFQNNILRLVVRIFNQLGRHVPAQVVFDWLVKYEGIRERAENFASDNEG